MGFIPYAYGTGTSDAYEYFTTSALGEVKLGTAMMVNQGEPEVVSGTEKPTYIAMKQGTFQSGDEIALIRIKPTTRFVTTFAANGAAVNLGDKLQISADGTQVTAATGGCFEVVEIRGTNIGDEVIGRFVEGGAA